MFDDKSGIKMERKIYNIIKEAKKDKVYGKGVMKIARKREGNSF